MKRIVVSLFVGAGLGMVAAFLIAPGAIEWYANPGSPNAISCAPSVEWALAKMRASIEIAGLIGAVLALIAVEVFRWLRKSRAKETAPLAQPQ